MDEILAKDFGKLLKRNALSMRRLMNESGTTAMRVYDQNIADLPITVDMYGPYVRITDYDPNGLSEKMITEICDIASRMLYIEPQRVIYHRREKLQGKEQHEMQAENSVMVDVLEGGLTFSVDLTKRVDTGLFLDQMQGRAAIRQISKGKDVLNLFSYTGSFSVYAASGGAKSVTSVDLSNTYTQWCADNLKANGFAADMYSCIQADALQFINEAIEKKEKYDIIIFDPPAFSNSRKASEDFDIQRDYLQYIHQLNRLLRTDGIIYFSANLKRFRFEKTKLFGFETKEITKEVRSAGFSAKGSTLRVWVLTKTGNSQELLDKEAHDKRRPSPRQRDQREYMKEEENDLVLHWDNEENTEKNARQRRFEKRHPDEEYIPPKPREEQTRPKDDRPPRRYSDDRRPRYQDDRRSSSDSRAPRRFDDRKPRYQDDRRGPGDSSRAPRRFDDDRRSSGDSRAPRRFDDERKPRYQDDRRAPREFDRDSRAPRRFDDRKPRYQDDRRAPKEFDRDSRAPRRFDDDRKPRYQDDRRAPREFDRDSRAPRRFDDRKPRYQDDRRAPREFDRDSRDPRRFDDRKPRYQDDRRSSDDSRAPRRFDDKKRPRYQDDRRAPRSFDDKPRRSSSGPKPYGYDRFKPSVQRGGQEEDKLRKDES